MNKEGKSATGAVRKTEGGVKAPDSSDAVVAAPAPVIDTKAEKKAKKATNDKASKIKREKEAAAKKLTEAEAAKRRGAYIKPGLAITSSKGIVAGAPKGDEAWEGDKVTSKHFGGDTYERLVRIGDIVEVK